MSSPNRNVSPVHFEDFDGRDFERLVMAYLFRIEPAVSWEWYGQVGSDDGRDICGQDGRRKICVFCANWKRLTFQKVKDDIDKLVKGPHGVPHELRLVTSSNLSAILRDKIKNYALKQGIKKIGPMLSGREFEESLRAKAESLLKRFCEGVSFSGFTSGNQNHIVDHRRFG